MLSGGVLVGVLGLPHGAVPVVRSTPIVRRDGALWKVLGRPDELRGVEIPEEAWDGVIAAQEGAHVDPRPYAGETMWVFSDKVLARQVQADMAKQGGDCVMLPVGRLWLIAYPGAQAGEVRARVATRHKQRAYAALDQSNGPAALKAARRAYYLGDSRDVEHRALLAAAVRLVEGEAAFQWEMDEAERSFGPVFRGLVDLALLSLAPGSSL